MRKWSCLFMCLRLCLLSSYPTKARSKRIPPKQDKKIMMWKLKSSTATMYLVGSIHQAKRSLYPLPLAFYRAIEHSNYLVLEAKPNGASMQEQMYIARNGVYKGNDRLRHHITKKTYRDLKHFLKTHNISMQGMDRIRPWLLANILMTKLISRLGYARKYGLESHFISHARIQPSTRILELEGRRFQLNLFATLPPKLAEYYLKSNLIPLSKTQKKIKELFDIWKAGDVKRAIKWKNATSKEGKAFNDLLFDKRNRTMTQKLLGYLRTKKTYFVLVGLGHLVGKNSIVDLLRKKGYHITQCTQTHY